MFIIGYSDIYGLKNTKESVLTSKYDKYIDGILIDVRMTKDNKLVLYSNDLVYDDYYISKMNYRDVMRLKIGSKVYKYFIPLLETIISKYPNEVLVIRLYHNYDKNNELINELKRIIKNVSYRIIILVNDKALYDYLIYDGSFEVYLEDNLLKEKKLVFIKLNPIYINGKLNYDIFPNTNDAFLVITDNPKLFSTLKK